MKINCVKVNDLNSDILKRLDSCINDNIKLYGKYKQYLFYKKGNNIYCFDTNTNKFINGNIHSNWVECITRFYLTDCSKTISFEKFNSDIIFTNESFEIVDKIFSYDYLKERKSYFDNNKYSSNKCISNDIWDAQSDYNYGLSIIYKNDNSKELYGVVDSNYNIVFNYNENTSKIKILNGNLLLIKNKDGLSSIYDINKGCLFDFSKKIDDVIILQDDIYKLKVGEKYLLYVNGKIIEDNYDDIVFDRNILIIEKDDEVLFYDLNLNLLYKTNDKEFNKSKDNIYYKKDNHIIEHNLSNGNESIIGRKKFIKSDGSLIKTKSLKSILSKYKYYYEDNVEGEIYFFEDEMYGISIEFDDVSVIKWYKNIDDIKKAKRNICNAIINLDSSLGEFDLRKKMIKQSGGAVGV